jgi:hypothetical protein
MQLIGILVMLGYSAVLAKMAVQGTAKTSATPPATPDATTEHPEHDAAPAETVIPADAELAKRLSENLSGSGPRPA